MDRYSNGSYVVKDRVNDVYMVEDIKSKDDIEVSDINETVLPNNTNNQTSLKEVDDRFMTIDDLLNDIEG